MKYQAPSQKLVASCVGRVLLPFLLTISSSATCAMDAISDEDLGGVTGEGVAFLPENTSMLFRGAGANESTSTLLTDRSGDTGYFRFIPVGPLTAASTCTGYPSPTCTHPYGPTTGKADIFLYGLAISRADGDSNSRLSATNPMIASWGTSSNPWLLKVQTENTQDFSTSNVTPQPVSYLALEAPLYDTTIPTTAAAGADAYNLKLAFWADIFNRRPDVAEGGAGQFDVGGANRQNRLRLQAIWDGLSLNGTNFKLFQTLAGATNTGGMSVSYNNTFGMAGLIRLNSGDSASVRAPVYSETTTDNTVNSSVAPTAWTLVHGGWDAALSASQTAGNCNNGSSVTVGNNSGAAGCQFMVQSGTRTDTKTRTVSKTSTWSTGSGLNKVLRLSTRETSGSAVDLTTPANNGTSAPGFAANEGLFLYSPNINLPLGSLQQPLTFGVAPDGRNLVLEVARIPNKAAAYNAIYTNYGGGLGSAAFTGSTCNVYQCGTSAIAGYQGSNATHGSISIGTTVYNPATNTLTGYKGADAAGVSFGNLAAAQGTTQTNTASTSTSANVSQARWIQRTSDASTTWKYRDFSSGDKTGTAIQWSYNGSVVSALTGVQNAVYSCCSLSANYDYPVASGVNNGWVHNEAGGGGSLCGNNNCTYYGTIANRNWTVSDMKGLTWSTASNPGLDAWLASQGSAVSSSIPNQAAAPPLPVVTQPNLGAVNLGSVVIDGILIQHLKFTTTGL